ncbi:MAG TPA: LuxR C-terminal-related transcriptional regulator [Burkholderiaceae bacterium]|nr:LuxR C-terminal-related transcriptional regulator [Burkholderiaceae bacterium]
MLGRKLAPPKPGYSPLERPALLEKLLRLQTHRYVLLSAPAGYGKTSLMSKCHATLVAHKERAAWLTLDSSDNDPARLQLVLRAALARAFCQEEWDASEAIPAADESRCTVFIDDLHILTEESAGVLHKFIVETLDPPLRFVMGSRNSNLPQLRALRNKGKLVEIDRADLALSLAETRTYLEGQLESSASEMLVDSLYRQTQGWPAALQMACAALRQRGIASNVAMEGLLAQLASMAAFLTGEVFEPQSAALQKFLLAVAVVNRFSAPLAGHLAASHDSAALIEQFFDAGIPAQQLEAGWYQLHPLLAGHLRDLARKRNPGRFSANGRLAAAWLAADGRPIDAVETLLATGNAGDAVGRMEQLVRPLLADAQYAVVIRWCECLSVETVQSSAILCSTYAICLAICNCRDQAALWSSRCAEQAGTDGADALYAGAVQLIRLYELVARGTPEQLESAEPLLQEAVHAGAPFERGNFAHLLAYVHLALGNYAAAEKSILISKRVFREEKRLFGLANAHYLEAIGAAAQGMLKEALSHLETVSLLARGNQARTPPGYLFAMSGGFFAALYYELNDFDQAALWVERDRCASALSTASDSMLCAALVGFRLALLQGRKAQAFALMEMRLAVAREGGFPRVVHALELELARYAVVSDQPEKADAYRAQLLEHPGSLPTYRAIRPSEETEGAEIAQARLMLFLGLLRQGRALVDALLADAVVRKRKWREAKLRILRAIALEKEGNAAEATEEITSALELGACMGLVRTFLDEGPAFVGRLRAFANSRHHADLSPPAARYLAGLLKAAEAEPPDRKPLAGAVFSEQEAKVLALIAKGRTNKDVACALALSVNTVKWHLAHIYTKLGVHNRSQAIFIARQRGLMS